MWYDTDRFRLQSFKDTEFLIELDQFGRTWLAYGNYQGFGLIMSSVSLIINNAWFWISTKCCFRCVYSRYLYVYQTIPFELEQSILWNSKHETDDIFRFSLSEPQSPSEISFFQMTSSIQWSFPVEFTNNNDVCLYIHIHFWCAKRSLALQGKLRLLLLKMEYKRTLNF